MDAGGAMELESFFAHAKAKAKCARRAEDRLNSYGSRLLEHGKWRRAIISAIFPSMKCIGSKPQESSPALPAQPETPNDGHLAGLLTYASWNLKRLPGPSRPFTPKSGAKWGPSQWHVAQVLSEYSCGAVADSHRASHYQMERSYIGEKKRGQGI